MRFVVCVLVALQALGVVAQQCEYLVNGKDDFTKELHVVTEAKTALSMSTGLNFTFDRTGNAYVIRMRLSNKAVQPVPAEATLMLKLANDTVLSFRATAPAVTEESEMYRWVNVTYEADRSRLDALALSPIVKVRVATQGQPLEYEVTSTRKNQQRIMEAVRCLLAVE